MNNNNDTNGNDNNNTTDVEQNMLRHGNTVVSRLSGFKESVVSRFARLRSLHQNLENEIFLRPSKRSKLSIQNLANVHLGSSSLTAG